MGRRFVFALLLCLLALSDVQSRPHALGLEKSLCSPLEAAPPQKAEVIFAGPTKFAPGYFLVVHNGRSTNSLKLKLDGAEISDVPEGSICTATGIPAGKRDATQGEALLSRCGLSPLAGGRDNVTATSSSLACIWKSEDVQPLAFVMTEAVVRALCLYETFVLEVTCLPGSGNATGEKHVEYRKHCFALSLQANVGPEEFQGRLRYRRHALSAQPLGARLPDSQVRESGVSAVVVGVAVGVVGLLVLVLVLAMCGGNADRSNTVHGEEGTFTRKTSSRAEVAEPAQELPDNTPAVKVLKTNGTPGVPSVGSMEKEERSSSRESAEHLSTPSLKDLSERGRTLSARSFDPLPEVPKLELAEGGKTEEGGDDGDEDDDDPYAEVPRDEDDRMADSGSDEEVKVGGAEASPIPPYGKVSRHSKLAIDAKDSEEVDDTDSYAEVRDVVRRGPLLLGQRERSHTQPPIPGEAVLPRDKRSQTESSAAHLPLPDIPITGAAMHAVEENVMYDSIREGQIKKTSPSSRPKNKEQLYESMDEVEDKDLYESVPDSFAKLDSPCTPKTLSTPTLAFPKMLSDVAPNPPLSPIPSRIEHQQQSKKALERTEHHHHHHQQQQQSKKALERTEHHHHHQQQQSKKALEKTLSASQSTDEGKRRFSFFNRKKTASVSSTRPKKEPESPTSLVASGSPQHKSPPLPNIPVPPRPDEEDDDDEDTYDRVTPGLPFDSNAFQLGALEDPKSKAMSLPMSYRTGGGRPNLPLPKVPEDSGSGTVQHQRVMEGTGGPVDYDMVNATIDRIPHEPNYDTVKVEDILVLPSATFDPPYDKIDKKELQEFRERELQSREMLRSSEPEDSTKYSVVRGEASVGNDQPGLTPDHDEEGYAVVPEELKMRKRAMSASQAVKQQQQLSPEARAAGYRTVRYQDDKQPHSMTVSSPSRRNQEDQYATVDLLAKRDKKQQELEEALRLQEELRMNSPLRASPIPPPLPPALNPDDFMEEFQEPPIPTQSDDMHELVASGELEEPGPDSRDPPYARVKWERDALLVDSSDPPYARVNELDIPRPDSGDPPYARVKSKTSNPYAEVNRPYAEVDVDWVQSHGARGSGQSATAEDDGTEEEDKPYDTIQNVQADMDGERCQLELDMPKLETAEEEEEDKPYDTIQNVQADMHYQLELDMPKLETAEEEEDKPYDTIQNVQADIDGERGTCLNMPKLETGEEEEDKPYDAIQNVQADMDGEHGTCQLELDMPKLETAEAANIYQNVQADMDGECDMPKLETAEAANIYQNVQADMDGECDMPKLETAEAATIYDSLLPTTEKEKEQASSLSEVSDTKRDTPRSMV